METEQRTLGASYRYNSSDIKKRKYGREERMETFMGMLWQLSALFH